MDVEKYDSSPIDITLRYGRSNKYNKMTTIILENSHEETWGNELPNVSNVTKFGKTRIVLILWYYL